MKVLYRKVLSSFLATVLLLSLGGIVQAEGLTDQSYTEEVGYNLKMSSNITVTPSEELTATSSSTPGCDSNWRPGASGYSIAIMQVNPMTNTLQWGFAFTPQGKAYFGAIVAVTGAGGSVTNTNAGYFRTLFGPSIYATHTEANDYLFHGSISKYNYNGGQEASLKSGDVVTITLSAVGTAAIKPSGFFSISCQVN